MKKILLIDLNNYFSRFFFANKENCIERYIKLIKDSIKEFSPEYLCNLIDAPTPFRKSLYSDYKSQRPEKSKEYYELLENLRFNLKKLNYPFQTSKSLEAEDLANLFVKNISLTEFIILSNDKDYLQLESENCKVFDYYNKRNESGQFIIFIQKSFKDLGLNSKEQFLLYLSLMGDSSDNIPGVKRIGKQKALELANQFENYNTLIETLNTEDVFGKVLMKQKPYSLILKDIENFQLSYKLICLFEEKFEFNIEKYKCI